jgi:hypothetical protein
VRESANSTPKRPKYYVVDRETGEKLLVITDADEAARKIRQYGLYTGKKQRG